MKVEALKEKLSDSISKAEKIAGKNLTLPVLSCLYIETVGNTLKIRATNLDLGIEVTTPVKVEREGIVAVPGNVLNGFLSSLKGDSSVFLEVEGQNLKVSTPHTSTIIKAFPHEDFPTIPILSGEKSFKINSADFVKGLKSVWYSAAISSMKPELSSVMITCDDSNNIVFVATDSFRLAEKRIKLRQVCEFNQILLPFKNVAEVIRVLEEAGDTIDVMLNKNQIAFSYGGVYLTSRIIDGTFPDYKQIIPKDFTTEIIVLKQDLVNYLKLSNIFSDKFNQINIQALPTEKRFVMTTKNSDVGENVSTVDAVFQGDDVTINFNYRYIIDCFQSIDSDSVSLNFNGISRPMVIKGVSDSTFTYLVMPMNR